MLGGGFVQLFLSEVILSGLASRVDFTELRVFHAFIRYDTVQGIDLSVSEVIHNFGET